MKQQKRPLMNSAFTLVELIVVIVILAILATIAFLSYQNHTSVARDSVRMSDISSIAKGLVVKSAVSNTFPDPDRKVIFYSWSAEIWYEGDAWENVLRNISSSATSFLDPLDKVRYTYSTNKTKSKYELMAFLESERSLSYDFRPFGQVSAKDYTGRYPFIKWDGLWIILYKSWSTYTPIQDAFSWWVAITSVNVLDPNPTLVVASNNIIWYTWVTVESTIWYTRPVWYKEVEEEVVALKSCGEMTTAEVTNLNNTFNADWYSWDLDYWCARTTLYSWKALTIPQELFYLTNLTNLQLYSNNNITSIPKEIGNLTNLTTLYLNDNPNMTSVPKEISQLTNLTYLDISAWKLTSLPKEILGMNKLTTLQISANQLTELPPEIKNLNNPWWPNLFLFAQYNKLTAIPKEIAEISNLWKLDISYNSLTNLPLELKNLTSLWILDIRSNSWLTTLWNSSALWQSWSGPFKAANEWPSWECISIIYSWAVIIDTPATATGCTP
ncbi:MAG: hypothetical protein ACD_3C00154G0007 [uncultured bacterium (gcode 4)]|uniref:Uncharacterized protein n=1 Tax=uncultured bacterium (gcode 4) TaxID=1234023 RepID=K2GC24_9BACT|nr:MAG: hypothetical protein ACD_3C00154G0007 [uncultured bacterium (gcode 4)]